MTLSVEIAMPLRAFRTNANRTRAASLLVLLLLAACGGTADSTSESPTSPDALECSECAVQVTVVRSLFDSTGDILSQRTLPAGGMGSLLVGPIGRDMAQLARYDSSDAPPRVIGERGDGPGQFTSIKWLTLRTDGGVLVLAQRLTRLDSGYRHLYTADAPGLLSALRVIALDNGDAVAIRWTPNAPPFVWLDSTLTVLREVGPLAAQPDSNLYALTRAAGGGFWAARGALRYELTRFDANGAIALQLQPTREWFPAWEKGAPGSSDPRRSRPQPRITGIHEIAPGKLLVLAIIADLRWAPSGSSSTREAGMPGPDEVAKIYDSVVEIIDAETGTSIAGRRFNGAFGGFTREGLLWELTDQDGTLRMRLIKVDWKEKS